MTRPPDWATASTEAMLTKTRMRKSVVAEVYPGFTASCYAGDSFLASPTFVDFRISLRPLSCCQGDLTDE